MPLVMFNDMLFGVVHDHINTSLVVRNASHSPDFVLEEGAGAAEDVDAAPRPHRRGEHPGILRGGSGL